MKHSTVRRRHFYGPWNPSPKARTTRAAALDVHPRVAMQILRDSKIAVTMEIYTEVPSAATRDGHATL